MMSKIFMLLLALCIVGLPVSRLEAASMQSYYMQYGKVISFAAAAEQLQTKRVIMFGEYHDNELSHQAELRLLEYLYAAKLPLALSLEMLERDVQPEVDAYLKGEQTETEFVVKSRPWPNYLNDYRPLVNLAKEQGSAVIAGNIPRYLAAAYAKSGSLDSIEEAKRQYLPREHRVLKNDYYDDFIKTMLSGETGMKMDEQRAELFYQAQSLKDDTMAESIADYLAAHPDSRVYHVQGAFHGHGRGGVAEKLLLLQPELTVGVVTSIYEDELTDGKIGKDDEIYYVIKRKQTK